MIFRVDVQHLHAQINEGIATAAAVERAELEGTRLREEMAKLRKELAVATRDRKGVQKPVAGRDILLC